MIDLIDFINEQLNEAEETIKNEDDFREVAKKKFKTVFGDKLDEDRMKNTIDGFLKTNSKLVKDNKWGQLIGMFNASFAK